MATQDEKDPFAFDIQLNTEEEGRDFHRKNDGHQIQRPDVVDDCCRGLLLQTRVDRIVHGHEINGSSPATLIVFGFRFHGIDEYRRFKQATVTINFQDEKKRSGNDPEVVALWPNGDFTLGEPTEVEVEETSGGEAGASVTAGSGIQGGGHLTRKWERKLNHKRTDRSTLTGSIILDMSVRDYGPNNAVRLTIRENKTAASGIVIDFRAALLLRRQNYDSFLGTVKLEAKAHFSYNALKGLRDILGLSPANDPVIFKPGVQYLRPPTQAAFLETKLAKEIDDANLNADALEGLAGVLGTTVLAISN
ncbi:hypothetical protein CTAM01_14345 [Colletotrichum tamarilloi]|uniref:Uncharacterized protein n=1 Tax=Colletotrichum tamarilloi TaxID=1209934 RepID=A0ABQ9QPH1_9PEZI|nr:uncharacterized protein CTAM01_14345 [Colletotrichum tamarilloi]KAK1480505.1 hypothetical protein CTAM01_14345 [Colletotrichum tamarilloi]